jgi:diguanylate cyclase (GGDEF)-like protein
MSKFILFYIFGTIVIVGFIDLAAYIQLRYIVDFKMSGMTYVVPSFIGTLFGILFSSTHYYYQKHKQMQIYKDIAMTDFLTGVTSRYACDLILDIEYNRYLRNRVNFSVVMIDIDDFKMINDTYGHEVGDEALCALTKCLESDLRAMDMVCRWGGEEFIVVLPETGIKTACKIAENLRCSVNSYHFKHFEHLSISLGVSSTQSGCKDVKEIIKYSDDALYEAKKSGKNRVICK